MSDDDYKVDGAINGFPPWYDQALKSDNKIRAKAVKNAIERIEKSKPEAFEFIKKFGCELIGIMPNIGYTLPNDKEADLTTTFYHKFSQTTLVYWCSQGEFAIFINGSLKYNEKGLRGFTW